MNPQKTIYIDGVAIRVTRYEHTAPVEFDGERYRLTGDDKLTFSIAKADIPRALTAMRQQIFNAAGDDNS